MKKPEQKPLSNPASDSDSLLGTLPAGTSPGYQTQLDTLAVLKPNNQSLDDELHHADFPRPHDGVPKPSGDINSNESGYVTVKELATRYGLSVVTIYSLIKTEPTFPYKNVGLRKKFMVNVNAYEKWINDRTEREKNGSFQIPTAAALIERYRK